MWRDEDHRPAASSAVAAARAGHVVVEGATLEDSAALQPTCDRSSLLSHGSELSHRVELTVLGAGRGRGDLSGAVGHAQVGVVQLDDPLTVAAAVADGIWVDAK